MNIKKEIVSTGLTVEKRQFTWKIDNFDMVRNSDKLIEDQRLEFKAGESIGLETSWVFIMSVRNRKEGDEEKPWIGIYLQCTNNNDQEVNVACQLSVKRSGMYGGYNNSFKKTYTASLKTWGYLYVLKKDAKLEELPLVDGSLLVELGLDLFAPAKITTTLNGTGFFEAEFEQKFLKNLQSDLGKLLHSSEGHSEVKTMIISKDNEEIGVIGCLLSARSPVFQAMLKSDMEEANTGVIRIDELSSKTISVLLQFIYTGTLHEEWSKPEVIVQLVYAAEKYHLSDLIEFLDNVLGQVSTKETGGKLLNLAKKLGMKKAEKEIFEKMKKELSSSDSSDDLMALISQYSESDILS